MRQSKEFQLKKKAIRKRWRELCKMSPQKLLDLSNRYYKFANSNVSLSVIREMILEAEFGPEYYNFLEY